MQKRYIFVFIGIVFCLYCAAQEYTMFVSEDYQPNCRQAWLYPRAGRILQEARINSNVVCGYSYSPSEMQISQQGGNGSSGFPGTCTMYFKRGRASCRAVTFYYKDGEARTTVSGDVVMQGTRYYKYTGASGGFLSFTGYTEKQVRQTRMTTQYVNGQAIQVPEFMHIEKERNGRSMSVSTDYQKLIFNGETYDQRISKQEYDDIQGAIARGANIVGSGNAYSGNSENSSNGSKHESQSSRHGDATCKGCSGSGRCTACGGTGNNIKEEYDSGLGRSVRTTSNCGVCRGTGSCGVCHGSGKIHY